MGFTSLRLLLLRVKGLGASCHYLLAAVTKQIINSIKKLNHSEPYGVPKAGIKYLFKYICHQLFQLERIVSLLLQFGSSCFTTFESNILFGLVQSSQTGDQPPIVSVFLGWTVHLKFKGLGKRYWAWISIQLREKTEINKKRSGRPWFRCTYKHFPNNSVLTC